MGTSINNNWGMNNVGQGQEIQKTQSNNRFVDKLKNACTTILDKLGFHKTKSLSCAQNLSHQSRLVTERSHSVNNVGFDDANQESKNIKAKWQEDLINVKTTKGIDAWVNAVVNNLQEDGSRLDKMFSRENGVFNIDKLSSEERDALKSEFEKIENTTPDFKVFKDLIFAKDFEISSINIKNIKEDWQKVAVSDPKHFLNWGVSEMLNENYFNEMFSRENGMFNIDKLSPKDLTAIKDGCDIYIKRNPSLELKAFTTFIGVKNPDTSIKDGYNSLRSLEKEIHKNLNSLKDVLNKKLEEGHLEELSKLLEEKIKSFENLTHFCTEIGIPMEAPDVKSQEDIMKNYNAKFLQDLKRDLSPLRRALDILKKEASPNTEIKGLLKNLGNYIQDSEHKSESIEMIRDFLEKHPKKNIQLKGSETLELESLNKIIKNHKLKPKTQSS